MKAPLRLILSTFVVQAMVTNHAFSLTLAEAVRQAVSSYPAVQAALEESSAAAAQIALARTKYLPRLDLLGQINRATDNNVFGLLLPQSVIPGISGPVLGTNSLSSVWGSAVGGLVTWEPFDFGFRHTNTEIARALRDQADTQTNVTKLQVGTAVADTFLTVVAAEQTIVAAQAGAERARTVNGIVETLVKNELRPGADASRAQSELAQAEIQVIHAQQAVMVGQAALAQLLGKPTGMQEMQSDTFRQLPPEETSPTAVPTTHPLAVLQQQSVLEAQLREEALSRSYFPKFLLQSALYARGTGANTNGIPGSGLDGLGPDTQNWAVGLTVTFPVFDIFSIQAQLDGEKHRESAAADRYQQVLRELNGELAKANAILAAARQIALKTPVQLEAARSGEQQALARYKSGLANVVEVAEAERILTQAEIDDRLAKLGVWRARLGVAAATGDLEPFLALCGK